MRMKWLTGVFIAGSITVGSPLVLANQIQNGSFETGTTSSWTVGSPSEATVSSDTASDGTYALKLQTTDGAISSTSQLIPVQANTDYVFTYDINYSAGTVGDVTAKLTFDGLTLKTVTTNSTAGWMRKQTWFNSGSATQVQLDLYADGGFNGLVCVDDFSLVTMAPPYAYETWTVDNYIVWAAYYAVSDVAGEDADGDGLSDLHEYAFTGNPTNSFDQGTAPTLELEGSEFICRTLQRNDDSNVTYRVEICTNLLSGVWTDAGFVAATNGTAGDFDDVGYVVPADDPSLFVRLKAMLPVKSSNDGYFELVAPGGTNNSELIQGTLDKLHPGATLKLIGDFFIGNTIYLPSDFKWILEGSLSLDNGVRDNLDLVGWYDPPVDARWRTGVTEKSGGAGNIFMSGGTYNGNAANNASTLRFINFVSVTNSYFHDMVITNVSDDNFTLGPGCRNNVCRNLISSFSIIGNALTDKGTYNKWFDCIAEDCQGNDGDGWTPKCSYSEFYRCIGRRNGGPGFGMYCRMDGSPTNNNLGVPIDGNKFYACESYQNWGGAGFSFNVSGNSGPGASIRSNYVEAICYSNMETGVIFRNKNTNGIVAANEINLLCWGNRGLAGLATDGGTTYAMNEITGSIVSFDNANYDVNVSAASNCNITAYWPAGENAPRRNSGSTSKNNIITVTNVSAPDPSDPWCVQAYYNATNIP